MKMKKMKKSIILLLIAAMILSSMSVAYAETPTASFTDISTNWAKQNIINVYNKGLMNGISATLFKPLDKVTNYSALVSLTRMTKAKDKYDLAALETKYKTSVLDKYKVPSYARQEVAYCLEAGIVTANDVSVLKDATYVTKQVVSAYIAKAFGIIYDSQKPIVFLGYNDAMFITSENKTYIKFLIDMGVLSSSGDIKGNFNPDSTVTRDMYARMLDAASDQYNSLNPSTPKNPSAGTGTTPGTGTGTTPGTGTGTAPGTGTGTTPGTAPGTGTTPTTPVIGTPNYTGKVDQVIIEYGNILFQIPGDNNTTVSKKLSVADNIQCIIDNVESSYYWKIKNGDKAYIYLNNEGKISKLIVESKVRKIAGTLESLLITDKLELNVNVKNVGSRKYYINNSTVIVKNKANVKYDSLKAGDNVVLTISDDKDVLEVNADSTVTTDNGIIESIIYTRTAAPKVTMIGLDGKNKEYFIRKNLDPAFIIVGNDSAVVYSLRPGMHASVELENDEIIRITATRTETNDKFSGIIKYINKDLKIITMTYFDSLSQTTVEKRVNISNSKLGNLNLQAINLDQLQVNDKIIVVGTENTGSINATMVILDK
jgi:hypothetical protein